jgi:hypothetical protein
VGLGRFFQFPNPIHSRQDSLDEWSARRKAGTYTQGNTNTERTQTSMPRVGFEPTIPAFERAKTVHALDGAATTTDIQFDKCSSHLRLRLPSSLSLLRVPTTILPSLDWFVRWLPCVDVINVADVSEVRASSNLMVEWSRMGEFMYIQILVQQAYWERPRHAWTVIRPIRFDLEDGDRTYLL